MPRPPMDDEESEQVGLLTGRSKSSTRSGSRNHLADVDGNGNLIDSRSHQQLASGAGGDANEQPKSAHMDPHRRKIYLLLLFLSVVSASAGFALIVYWMFYHRKMPGLSLSEPHQLSNLHPILMYFFMFGMNLYAVLLYRTHYSQPKSTLKWTHALLGMANIIFSLLGVAAMFWAHVQMDMANFYSLHSWIGAATNALYLSQLLAGVAAFLRPATTLQARKALMPWHRAAGSLILVMAALAAITGIAELVIFQDDGKTYAQFAPITFIANFAGLFTVLATGIAVFLLATPVYMREVA